MLSESEINYLTNGVLYIHIGRSATTDRNKSKRSKPEADTIMIFDKSGAIMYLEHIDVLSLFVDSLAQYQGGHRLCLHYVHDCDEY
ncbi:hypothetical protein PGQ11_000184 [Apiospora arundinis]